MIHTVKTILSLSIALLLCFAAFALAAPPDGKGKAGKGKAGKGNQPIDAIANFFSGDIISNGLQDGRLQGEFIDNGGFDTLIGQMVPGETITVGGDAGEGLVVLDSLHSILPTGASYGASCAADCLVTFAVIPGDENSGVTWTIRLDRDKQPENRVQLRMRWVNGAGRPHHLRIGWVTGAYPGEKYPLDPIDYGEVPEGVTSLESATVTFDTDLFRIDGQVPTGRGKKTVLEVFSRYGEQYHPDDVPWCAMGGLLGDLTCRESTTIQTDLVN